VLELDPDVVRDTLGHHPEIPGRHRTDPGAEAARLLSEMRAEMNAAAAAAVSMPV